LNGASREINIANILKKNGIRARDVLKPGKLIYLHQLYHYFWQKMRL